jgi:TetR/AcrR family transcriptional regulator, transcriptional repressor for nem operon
MTFVPRSEATHRQIIELSAELFNQKGVSATSISDLEKATGMTRGSIYGNFANKDAVALAAFDYNWDLKRKLLLDGANHCELYKDKLLAHVLLHHPSARTPFTAGGCPLQNTTMEADDTNEVLRSKAATGLIVWTNDLTALIQHGIEAKEFKAGIDILGTALHIISIIQGAALFARSTQDMEYVNRLLDTAKKVIDDISVLVT